MQELQLMSKSLVGKKHGLYFLL